MQEGLPRIFSTSSIRSVKPPLKRTGLPLSASRFSAIRNLARHKTLMRISYEAQDKRLLTKEEREAKKEKARREAEINLAARKKQDDPFERLRAERPRSRKQTIA